MGDTCNKLLEPEDVTVGATVGKYLNYGICSTCQRNASPHDVYECILSIVNSVVNN